MKILPSFVYLCEPTNHLNLRKNILTIIKIEPYQKDKTYSINNRFKFIFSNYASAYKFFLIDANLKSFWI